MTRRMILSIAVLAVLAVGAVLLFLNPLEPDANDATLAVGDTAPLFVTKGALDGQEFDLDLAAQLADGPVVLYFYPKAFTKGCTLEANAFSEATADFEAAGAQVIGMSADDLDTLKEFSVSECRGKFAVATASPETVADYGVAYTKAGVDTGLTTRTSFVIAPDGTIVHVHSDMDYKDHVSQTLAAVRELAAKG